MFRLSFQVGDHAFNWTDTISMPLYKSVPVLNRERIRLSDERGTRFREGIGKEILPKVNEETQIKRRLLQAWVSVDQQCANKGHWKDKWIHKGVLVKKIGDLTKFKDVCTGISMEQARLSKTPPPPRNRKKNGFFRASLFTMHLVCTSWQARHTIWHHISCYRNRLTCRWSVRLLLLVWWSVWLIL